VKIFFGIGNPGNEYKNTRHNAGVLVIENFLDKFENYTEKKHRYFISYEISLGGKETILVKPRTYINESGISFKKVLDTYKVDVENVIVIHDDLGIETGKIKIVFDKGDNGHKGIISIFNTVETKNFYRIRIGIGKGKIEIPYVDYVLSPFEEEEKELIKSSIEKAVGAIEEIIRSGIERAMTIYNR